MRVITKVKTDRASNCSLKPFTKSNSHIMFLDNNVFHDISYKINSEKNNPIKINDYWYGKHHMMLDIITDVVANKIFEYKIPISNKDKRITENKKNYNLSLQELQTMVLNNQDIKHITISEGMLFKYPQLKKYSLKELYKMLKHISNTKFKLLYKVRIRNGNKFDLYDWCNYDYEEEEENSNIKNYTPQSFFNIELIEPYKESKNIQEKEREFKISFNDFLSRCYLNNILNINFDNMDVNLYDKLTDNSLSIFRKFLLIIKNNTVIRLSFLTLKNFLGFKTKNNTMVKKVIKNCLDELKENNLITWYQNDFNLYKKIDYFITKI